MNEVIESVMASRRLKKFTAIYAMIYISIQLVLNLLYTYIPFLGTFAGKIIYKVIALVIEAPFLFGLIRGIFTRNYKVSHGISAFKETKNYGVYSIYVLISTIFEIINLSISLWITNVKSNALSISFSLIFFVLRILLSFFLVRFYYDIIVLKSKISLLETSKGCIATAKKSIGTVIGAEMFKIFAGFASFAITSMLASLLPKHQIVPPIITCFSQIQYGFIIFVWPVYYLCYKKAFESKY